MWLLLLLLSLADGPKLPWARIQRPSVGGQVRFQVEDVAVVAPRRSIARGAHLCHCDQKTTKSDYKLIIYFMHRQDFSSHSLVSSFHSNCRALSLHRDNTSRPASLVG